MQDEEWIRLCKEIEVEQNSVRLIELVARLNRVLDEKDKMRLRLRRPILDLIGEGE